MKNNSGFTLIELVISLAIVGILAAVAVLEYQVNIAKSQMTEALNVSREYKVAISLYYSETNKLPTSVSDLTVPKNPMWVYVSTVSITNGQLIIHMKTTGISNRIGGAYLMLKPQVLNDHDISWTCNSTVDQKYLSETCTGSTAYSE